MIAGLQTQTSLHFKGFLCAAKKPSTKLMCKHAAKDAPLMLQGGVKQVQLLGSVNCKECETAQASGRSVF